MASREGVRILAPNGAIEPTGTWSLGARAGDFVFIAGMRGINPANNRLVEGDEARIRCAFTNMKLIAESEGAGLSDCVRLTVFITDMNRLRPLVNKVQEELWAVRHTRHGRLLRSPVLTRTTFSRSKLPSTHQKADKSPDPSWVGAALWDTYINNQGGRAAQQDEIPWASSN
jgi:enamine deaminase RidA (YjgF/YER057c/UK114 family)